MGEENEYSDVIHKIMKITNQILKIPAVTCNEKPLISYLKQVAEKKGYNTEIVKGALIVNKNEGKRDFLFTCHIDRNGIIKSDSGLEYSYYKLKKDLGKKVIGNERDLYLHGLLHTNTNVIAYNPKDGVKSNSYKIKRFDIDSTKKEVTYKLDKKPKKNEEVFMFDSKVEFDKDSFYGQIDNAISVSIILYLIENHMLNHTAIFSINEEIGLSEEGIIAYSKNRGGHNKIISFDTSPYQEFTMKKEGFLVLRKGDSVSVFDPKTINVIERILKKLKIPFEYKNPKVGITEIGRLIEKSKGKYKGASLQLPTLNYHTVYETATLTSLSNYVRTIIELTSSQA